MTRTDEQRMAWCAKQGASINFYFEESDERPLVEVDVMFAEAERRIRSYSRALDAWRRCVDELMDKEEAHD